MFMFISYVALSNIQFLLETEIFELHTTFSKRTENWYRILLSNGVSHHICMFEAGRNDCK